MTIERRFTIFEFLLIIADKAETFWYEREISTINVYLVNTHNFLAGFAINKSAKIKTIA